MGKDGGMSNRCRGLIEKIKFLQANVTIEPAVFLISFLASLDFITIEQLIIEKTCANDFNLTADVCYNLVDGQHLEENTLVQNEVRIRLNEVLSQLIRARESFQGLKA